MIIDTHIHWPVTMNSDHKSFLQILDRFNIDHVLLMGYEVLWKVGDVSECNDRLVEFCGKVPNRMSPLATVHLSEGERAVREARRCLEKLKVCGFKFHPWVQGESFFREEMYEICRMAGEHGVPIVFHDGTPPYSLPSQIGLLAEMFPGTLFTLGHGGILFYWQEALETTKRYNNIIITLCGQHPWAMQKICDQVAPDRILFGTDFVGPGAEEYIAYRKGLVEGLKLPSELREKIMSKNAQRIFKLS
ncbi:MAG: amidohydrolase family protein [Phycisphaerae bacterium]